MRSTVSNDKCSSWSALRRRGLACLGMASLLAALTLRATAAPSQEDPADDTGEEVLFLGGSYPLEDAAGLLEGDIDFSFVDGNGSSFEFTSEATDFTEYPGSLYLAETPFGPGALLAGANPGDSPFYFVLPSVGVFVPLSEVDSLSYVGPLGSGTLTVAMKAVTQGPDGTRVGLGKTKDGRVGILITAPCVATFKQFVTKTITWKGTTPGPGGTTVPTSGSYNGPVEGTANAGEEQRTDGQTVYVDARAPGNGDYSNVENNPNGTTTMSDLPSVDDPTKMAEDIERKNPGNTVTEFTVTWRFTVYVYCGGAVREKVRWTYSRTYKEPFDGPQGPGGFRGSAAGPPAPRSRWAGVPPTAEPAGALEPQHQAALDGFQAESYGGAQTSTGW
jgi:hypothetical protein